MHFLNPGCPKIESNFDPVLTKRAHSAFSVSLTGSQGISVSRKRQKTRGKETGRRNIWESGRGVVDLFQRPSEHRRLWQKAWWTEDSQTYSKARTIVNRKHSLTYICGWSPRRREKTFNSEVPPKNTGLNWVIKWWRRDYERKKTKYQTKKTFFYFRLKRRPFLPIRTNSIWLNSQISKIFCQQIWGDVTHLIQLSSAVCLRSGLHLTKLSKQIVWFALFWQTV